MADNIATLVPAKTDKEIADDLRSEMSEVLENMITVLNKARNLGFIINFSTQENMLKKNFVSNLSIVKPF